MGRVVVTARSDHHQIRGVTCTGGNERASLFLSPSNGVVVCQVGYSWFELTTFRFIERQAHTFGEVTGQMSSHVKCGDVIVLSCIVEAYPPLPPPPVGEYLRENAPISYPSSTLPTYPEWKV